MKGKKSKKIKDEVNPNEDLKIEAAEELGLMDKVRELGWGNLPARETGRIGAIVKKKLREIANKDSAVE